MSTQAEMFGPRRRPRREFVPRSLRFLPPGMMRLRCAGCERETEWLAPAQSDLVFEAIPARWCPYCCVSYPARR